MSGIENDKLRGIIFAVATVCCLIAIAALLVAFAISKKTEYLFKISSPAMVLILLVVVFKKSKKQK